MADRRAKEASSTAPLKPAVFHILLALAAGDNYGYAVMQSVRRTSDGRVPLSPGSFYRHLAKLMNDGLVAELSQRRGSDDPRRGVLPADASRPERARGGTSPAGRSNRRDRWAPTRAEARTGVSGTDIRHDRRSCLWRAAACVSARVSRSVRRGYALRICLRSRGRQINRSARLPRFWCLTIVDTIRSGFAERSESRPGPPRRRRR